jgi:hypothetical protein
MNAVEHCRAAASTGGEAISLISQALQALHEAIAIAQGTKTGATDKAAGHMRQVVNITGSGMAGEIELSYRTAGENLSPLDGAVAAVKVLEDTIGWLHKAGEDASELAAVLAA